VYHLTQGLSIPDFDLIEFDMATLIIASTGMLDSRITGLLEKIKEELGSRLYHNK
jgi:hypothetical protein